MTRLKFAQGRWRGSAVLVALREGVLAALPAVLTVTLLLLATQPAYRALISSGNGWTPYAYQALAHDVQAYEISRLRRDLTPAQVAFTGGMALSSAIAPAQFGALAEVERLGEARLSRVAALLRQDSVISLSQASREAVALNAQAAEYARGVAERYVRQLARLQRILIVTAILTGLLSMLLTARALIMWRAERHRRTRRETRQREALQFASHELRRPLQSLLLASDLLRHADSPERQQYLLAMIEDSAAQLASRADLTRLSTLYLDVTLRVEATDLCAVLRPLASARVSVALPDVPVIWRVDRDRVRQIMENLVENALKYTRGPVEVRLRVPKNGLEITVRDFGPGLPADQMESVFLPFERGELGQQDGHGLGLPLVRRYARAHGGDVTLAPAVGGGLVATVRLGEPPSSLAEPRRPTLFE
ncbi:sensor histidine kinase [Deinococcus yunweiensis]|uniref:sensor histidine kinase n=1 Tax=Deinococcus yunweiensis TaxID=367282 RepID=UPI00398F78F8